MEASYLKKIASRRINRRLIVKAALEGLSETIPSDIKNETERAETQKKIEEYIKEFQVVYNQLVNNVRVNLQKELKPIFEAFKALSQISELETEVVAENLDNLERQVGSIESRMQSGKNQAIRLMRTIVQQCNDIINSLRT